MIVDEVAMLLSLTRRVNNRGDELISQANKLYVEHAREVLQLRELWEEIGQRLDMEERRFERYFPREIREEHRSALPAGHQPPRQAPPPQEPPPKPPTNSGSPDNQSLAERLREVMPKVVQRGPKTSEGMNAG